MYTEQFITERSYLKGVSQATIQWYHSSFKAFEGALDSKQAIIERIGTLRLTISAISVNTYLRCLNAYFRWRHDEHGVDPKGRNLKRAHTLTLLLLDTGLRDNWNY